MRSRLPRWCALAASVLILFVGPSTAGALTKAEYACQAAIAKEATKFVHGELKLRQKCIDANMEAGGAATCPAPDSEALQKLRDKLDAGLAKKCTFDVNTPFHLDAIGFPGQCSDADPTNGFTLADLELCIRTTHERLLTGVCVGGGNGSQSCSTLADCPAQGPGTSCRGILTIENDPSVTGPLTGSKAACQKALVKSSAKLFIAVMKAIQACRNATLNCKTVSTGATSCKIDGILGTACAIEDAKTADAITKAKAQAQAAITAKCANAADVAALKACDPDQATGPMAATCETETHQSFVDDPNPAAISDFLDVEYATPGICGDNRKNQLSEECDGGDATACPGLCGAPDGLFPCLCLNVPRQRIVEHGDADFDNGWTGLAHDSHVVEGSGYLTDLFDCDGAGGPDTLCTVGPSCNLAPHQPCSPGPNATGVAANADTLCPGAGNFCRMTAAGANGPHCEIEFRKRCQNNTQCTTPNDRCVTTLHGAPIPISAGGVSACLVMTFSEDVVGTADLATGAAAVRLRETSTFHTGGSIQEPCPVCGGFCSGPGGSGVGTRTLCTTDTDCTNGATCVATPVCSYGPNVDKACRPDPPYGGPTTFYGNPSVDCPPNLPISAIDILFNPATTSTATATANIPCNATGNNDKVCLGGANDKRICTATSECPGGSCNAQCYCGGGSQQPNACLRACFGGANDALSCETDSECPGGFCRVADCRANPTDTDSSNEGICSLGPLDGNCSGHSFRGCTSDAQCQAPSCAFCDPGETCVFSLRQCFTNGQYSRTGSPGVPDKVFASTYCIAGTSATAVNTVAGFPGPGALTQPVTTFEVGF